MGPPSVSTPKKGRRSVWHLFALFVVFVKSVNSLEKVPPASVVPVNKPIVPAAPILPAVEAKSLPLKASPVKRTVRNVPPQTKIPSKTEKQFVPNKVNVQQVSSRKRRSSEHSKERNFPNAEIDQMRRSVSMKAVEGRSRRSRRASGDGGCSERPLRQGYRRQVRGSDDDDEDSVYERVEYRPRHRQRQQAIDSYDDENYDEDEEEERFSRRRGNRRLSRMRYHYEEDE